MRILIRFTVLFSVLLLPSGVSALATNIVIENDNIRYAIDKQGRNLQFTDKKNGTDYLNSNTASYCASVMREGKEYFVSSASLSKNILSLAFEPTGVTARILINISKDRITMEVISLKGTAESLTFVNVPLSLEALPSEAFGACVLSMNLHTRVFQLPALQTHLRASCYKRFGFEKAKITLLGLPQEKMLPVIRDVIKNAEDIPHSTAGGAWAQLSKEGYGSYLMNFGMLTEQTVDEWIAMCNNVGFTQIDNHGGGFFKFGSFELNPEKWPDGWNSFKRINKRLHDAGISSIFHTYAFFIDKKSKYVTPVPSADLAYFGFFTLAEPVDPEDSVIVVKESTENISTITGFFVQNSRTLRIGNELIEFSGVTKSPPYKFTGCKRGLNGTKASTYKADNKAYHLKEIFGLFVPGPETKLFKEIARRAAEVVNEADFDGIYLDAIDGSSILDSEHWYYSTQFVAEIAKRLKRPVGMEMSAMEHHWWHYRSRWQAWDAPHRGYKRFVDIHLAAINGGLLLPLHLGWWQNFTWDPPQTETTFTDDIEYIGCKMIGNDAGLAMISSVDKKTLDGNPSFRRLNAIIRQYEELRHKNYFGEDIKKLLRQPGKEFTLFKEKNDSWNFKPVVYQKHKVAGLDHPSASWNVNNEFDSQPVRLRIEPLMSAKPYNDPENVVLADFSSPEKFSNGGTANGVSGSIRGINSSTEKTVSGEADGIFSALSSGVSPRNGSWIKMEKKFEPWLNLSKNQALGVRIKGDGNGELLNFRIESPLHLSYGARGDHFVKIDFTDWRYFELVEIESAEFSNYTWSENDMYNTYRNPVQFNNVDKLQLWYNNLPAGKTVTTLLGPVKALPLVSTTITNPTVMIGGEKIVFPVSLESGMYLEFRSSADCKLYGTKGEFLKDVPVLGNVPALKAGNNNISFTCDAPTGINPRVQVTVIGEGKPLAN